jgi:hypothetical protein
MSGLRYRDELQPARRDDHEVVRLFGALLSAGMAAITANEDAHL